MLKKLNLFIISMICFIQPVMAYDSTFPSTIKHALKHSTEASYYVQVVIALGVVILLIYITGIIYAKLNVLGYKTAKTQYKGLEDSKIIIRSTTQIGNNKTLHVIELAGKKMLIGVTNESINLIKDLDEKQEKEQEQEVKVSKSFLEKELESRLPLDKIYPKEKKIEEEISIDKKVVEEKETEEPSEYDSEEYGLYKKYLND